MVFSTTIWDYLIWDDDLLWEDKLFGCMTLNVKYDWESTDYLTYDDLNRIEGNINCVKEIIKMLTKDPATGSIIENWTILGIPLYSDLNRIEGNTQALIDRCYPIIFENPKTTWVKELIDFEDLNRIEYNIKACFDVVCNIVRELRYCGALNCGYDLGLLSPII